MEEKLNSKKPLLDAIHTSFKYSTKTDFVFSDLSLSILEGDVILLMGPSGCGKSSLAYCLAGLYPAYTGRLEGIS